LRRVVKVRGNLAAIVLTCPRTATAVCAGTLSLVSAKAKVGTQRFVVAPGRSTRVRVGVKRARRSLGRRAVKVRAVAVTSAAGLLDMTTRRTLTLKRAR
jgi:hypothetical protein